MLSLWLKQQLLGSWSADHFLWLGSATERGTSYPLTEPKADLSRELKWFNASFYEHSSHQLDAPTARLFADTMEDAFGNADVIGVREFPIFDDRYSELECARDTLPTSIRGSLGMISSKASIPANAIGGSTRKCRRDECVGLSYASRASIQDDCGRGKGNRYQWQSRVDRKV